uniref:G-protein coupled receptors family 1 profile domain-containing protein n=1 Tax=Panagrolaimus davidi TaxID=227884 RepID=A0A914Q9Y5_9BILA
MDVKNYSALYKDLSAKVLWYNLHSSYIEREKTVEIQQLRETQLAWANSITTNFIMSIETKMVIDRSQILRYGSIECSAPGKEAYFDSYFSCFLFQLPYFLENIQFGYLCGIFIIPIMLISIFGKIKESYRWFLLNQAIWDVFTCYSFICEKPTILAWSSSIYSTCFYKGRPSNPALDALFMIIKGAFRNSPYIPLFLLAFSRCIALYCPKFYQRHNQTWKILTFIIIFDIVAAVLSSGLTLYGKLIVSLDNLGQAGCFSKFCNDYSNNSTTKCFMENEKYFQCSNEVTNYYSQFSVGTQSALISITPAMFILVILSVTLLFIKLSFQIKYQLKHNRHAFLKTLRVAVVILIQSITPIFFMLITAFQTYLQTTTMGEIVYDYLTFTKLPYGLFLFQSVATTTCINILRIFFDSVIVITVLSGYRKRIVKFIVFLFNFLRYGPRKKSRTVSMKGIN